MLERDRSPDRNIHLPGVERLAKLTGPIFGSWGGFFRVHFSKRNETAVRTIKERVEDT